MTVEIKLVDCNADDLEEMAPFLVQAMKNKLRNLRAEARASAAIPELLPDLPLQEVPEITPEPVNDEPQPDLETVRSALNKLKLDKGTEAVRGILEKFNAKRVPDLDPAQYLQVLDEVERHYETKEE